MEIHLQMVLRVCCLMHEEIRLQYPMNAVLKSNFMERVIKVMLRFVSRKHAGNVNGPILSYGHLLDADWMILKPDGLPFLEHP